MTSNELEIFKQSILDEVRVMMQTTGQVTQYIGARYVPLFAEPFEWDINKEYEPLTIVTNQGNSFTSRQFVPKGTPITNEQFWALTSNFNAQIEQYRQEVQTFDERITAAQNAADSKAPINHATDSTEYGVGNSMNYGHVKLADSDTPATSTDNDGIAATPKYVSDSIKSIDKTELVVIGDSWCDKVNAPAAIWPDHVASKQGLTLHNYSQSGIGDNLDTLIEKFKSDSFDKKKVKYVIFMAGVNVNINNIEEKGQKWGKFVTQVKELVAHDTKIYWMFNNFVKFTGATQPNGADLTSIYHYAGLQHQLIRTMTRTAPTCNCVAMLPWFQSSMFDETGYHLTETYQRSILARNINNMLNGVPIEETSIYNYRIGVANKFQVLLTSYMKESTVFVDIILEGIIGQSVNSGFNETINLDKFWGVNVKDMTVMVKDKPVYVTIDLNNGKPTLNLRTPEQIQFDKGYRGSAVYSRPTV